MSQKFLSALITENGPIDWNLFYPEEFVYTPTQGLLTAAAAVGATPGQANGTIQISSDAPFIITSIGADVLLTAWADLTPATMPQYPPTDFIANARVQFVDGGSGKNLYNAPIPLRQLCGQSGSDRRDLVAPRILGANTTLNINLFNFDTTRTMPVFFTFFGVKALPRSMPLDQMQRVRAGKAKSRLSMGNAD